MESSPHQDRPDHIRRFLRDLMDNQKINISTIHIEYFPKDGDWQNPIIFKIGHADRLKNESI